MVGENFEIYVSETAKNALSSSTMVGENFKNYISEMAMVQVSYPQNKV